MKRALFAPLLMLFFIITSFAVKQSGLTIQDALAQKKISIRIKYEYVSNDHSIQLTIQNLTAATLDLQVPVGTIFLPDDTGAQTLINAQEQFVKVEGNKSKTFPEMGFCTQLHHHGSDESSTFKLGFTNRPKVLAIANYLDSIGNVPLSAKQEAIWCVSDGEDVSNVYLDDTAKSHTLRKELCSLTGQKDTWYNTEREITQDEELNFIPVPKEVKGELSFHTDVQVEIQGCIKDADGKILFQNPKKSFAGPGDVSFDFALTVQGWKAGTYHVVYTSNGTQLLDQAFTI